MKKIKKNHNVTIIMDTQKYNVKLILWTEFDKAPHIASFCLTFD